MVINNQMVNGPPAMSGVLDLVSQAKASIAALPGQMQAHVAPMFDDLETEARKSAPGEL
jgi:hypothetical protein